MQLRKFLQKTNDKQAPEWNGPESWTANCLEPKRILSGVRVSCPPHHVMGYLFFCWCLLGAFLSIFLTKIKILDGTLRYCVARSQRPTTTTTTTAILRPIRSQFYVQFDLNFTSNSISIIRPIRPQFYVQFDHNFTSNSTSILRPDRNQWDNFFLPTVRSWGDMKLPLPKI